MKYLVAATLETRFLWEARVQLTNFEKVGINPDNVHYTWLVVGPEEHWLKQLELLKAEFPKVHMRHFYDSRRPSYQHDYQPTARPHMLAQLFLTENIFQDSSSLYIDSDVLFTKKLPELELSMSNIMFGSDTYGYTSPKYIMEKGGPFILADMAQIAGIDYMKVFNEGKNDCIGAQVMVKDVDEKFWLEVERVSYELNRYMVKTEEYFKELTYRMTKMRTKDQSKFPSLNKFEYNPIQNFCADMWAFRWVALKYGKKLQSHQALDFVQATDEYDKLESVNIYHNNGVVHNLNARFSKTNCFHKQSYNDKDPFFENRDHCTIEAAAYFYAEAISEYEATVKTKSKLKPV